MKIKVRYSAIPDTVEGETRYKLMDHMGQWWVNHEYSRYLYQYGNQIASVDMWRENTSESPQTVIVDHAPILSSDYEIIPSDTRLVKITIEFLSAKEHDRPFQACVRADDMPLFNVKPQAGEFYAFATLDGVQELFLYSDIKHISFKEF